MNKLYLCNFNIGCHSLRNATNLGKMLYNIPALASERLATAMSMNLSNSYGAASNTNGPLHRLPQQYSLKQDCLHGSRQRLLLKSEMRELSMSRGFKSQSSGQNERGKIALWKRVGIVATICGAAAYSFYSVNHDKAIDNEKVRYEEFKKAELGGDWTLIDHHGNKRSSTEFRGKWILLYMGFTHCPDICPEELEKLVKIVKAFDDNPKLPSMLPIFITLDPDRDTPKVIKDYLDDYKCPRLLGFTAPSEKEIKEVATKYRAYFSKGPPDEDNDYIVDHTIIIYLVSPKGEFVNYFDRSRSAELIIKTVTDHIHKFNELERREK